jgi:DNA-binding NtrC family response regulator
MNTVLVVDDKEMLRDSVGATLQRAGFQVVTAEGGPQALEQIARRRPDCVVTDLKMPGMTGLELVEKAREIDDALPLIVMTAYGAVDTAVRAIKLGASDYLTKPFEGDELVIAVKRAVEHARVVRENAVLRSAAEGARGASAIPVAGAGLARIVGESAAMRRVKQQVMAVAESHGTVLICGESGTGKEVVARAVHELSPRTGEAFLAVNCAALSESLLESELFGHERGAFTGAEKLRKGRFELADRGTLLLDEISEVSARVQAKLLRVLQERQFERVGSSLSIGVDVRVVATSNRDLPKSVARGDFRQDLFFRLNVLPIHLPALRDRLEDVPSLVEHFAGLIAAREGKPVRRFSAEALGLMQAYSWPGNVRELQNIVERAVVLSRAEEIDRAMIEPWLMTAPAAAQVISAAASSVMVATPGLGGGLGSGGYGGALPSVAIAGMGGMNGAAGGTTSAIESKPPAGMLPGLGDPDAVQISGRALEDIERDAIVRTLTKYNGHRQRTAQALGIGVRTLGLKLKKWKQMQLVDAGL